MPLSVKKAVPRRGDPVREEERRELMQSLSHTRTLINQAYGGFNNTSDSDLIESYVFEINSLRPGDTVTRAELAFALYTFQTRDRRQIVMD